MTIGKARAYTNIALIKYWGKRDEQLILPMNSSLSLTLDTFYTETSVHFDTNLNNDLFLLNGQKQALDNNKVTSFLTYIRKEYGGSYAKIESTNYVPTAAGLASSASGFAALAGACAAALKLNLSDTELSRLARHGSGSACRSIFGGFAEWQKGTSDQDSYAVPVLSNGFENELAMLFVLVDSRVKDISSRDGMRRTVQTSSFYDGWLSTIDQDIKDIKTAIIEKDFQKLGEITEANSLRMHGTTLAASPPFTYWIPESLKAMQIARQLRNKGIACYTTMDAGPNVKILVKKNDLTALKNELLNDFSEEQLITAYAGPGISIN